MTLKLGLDFLQAFYDKATSSEDKAKALQLLSAIRSGEERPQEPCPRPHTAMPAFGISRRVKIKLYSEYFKIIVLYLIETGYYLLFVISQAPVLHTLEQMNFLQISLLR
jgi:hypothetical protein